MSLLSTLTLSPAWRPLTLHLDTLFVIVAITTTYSSYTLFHFHPLPPTITTPLSLSESFFFFARSLHSLTPHTPELSACSLSLSVSTPGLLDRVLK